MNSDTAIMRGGPQEIDEDEWSASDGEKPNEIDRLVGWRSEKGRDEEARAESGSESDPAGTITPNHMVSSAAAERKTPLMGFAGDRPVKLHPGERMGW